MFYILVLTLCLENGQCYETVPAVYNAAIDCEIVAEGLSATGALTGGNTAECREQGALEETVSGI